MFDIETTLSEYGLTVEQYEELLKDCSDKVGKISDLDWGEILNKYSIDWNGDTCRKAQQPPLLGGAFVREYYLWKQEKNSKKNTDSYSDEINVKIRELERKKIQFHDERNEWNKQNRIEARIEQKLDYLEKEFMSIGKSIFEIHNKPIINSDNDLLVQLSDLHIGQTFKSIFGEYNTNIAKSRMEQYLNEILKIQKRHNSQNAIVVLQGDVISGSIHRTIQVSNRENVIEQIKVACELINSFCYSLTEHFSNVQIYNVSGNHSRMTTKDDSIHSERLDDLIGWFIGKSLDHIENFHYMSHRNIDTGIADINIRNKTYLAVHGDYDSYSKSGMQDLCTMLGFMPEAILFGHLHHCSYDDIQCVKLIRSGSLPGCGDDYTIEKRIIGKPSQMVSVCDDNGIVCCYPIVLN